MSIDFHLVSDSDPEFNARTEKHYILLGGSQIIPDLVKQFNMPRDHTDFRVFPTREEALDPSNGGHSVLLLCNHIDRNTEAVVSLLQAGNFSFSESGDSLVAFVRAECSPVVASSRKPSASNQATNSKGTSEARTASTVTSGPRHRLSDLDYACIQEVLTLIWPRDPYGVPKPARDRAFGGEGKENINNVNDILGSDEPRTTPVWVKKHLSRAFNRGTFDEKDVSKLMDAASK